MDGLNDNIRKSQFTSMGYYWQKLQVLRLVLAFQFGKGLRLGRGQPTGINNEANGN